MQSPDPNSLRRAKHIALWGSGFVIAVVYAVWIPMKWQGILPAHMTWLRVLLAPIFAPGLVCAVFFTEGERLWLWLCMWTLLIIVVMLAG